MIFKIITSYLRTIFLVTLISFLSLMNLDKMPTDVKFFEHFDKFAHFIMYLTLSFIFLIENYAWNDHLRRRWVILETISFSILLEFLQYCLTDYRSGSIYDAIFNILGVFVGTLLFITIKQYTIIYKLMLIKPPYKA